MTSASPCLSVESIACQRGGRQLFSDLSFVLQPGTVLQILGPNGSGKTTLLRILCGLRRPDSGRVCWAGKPVSLSDDDFTEALSYIGFQSGIKLDLSPRENLDYARALSHACRMSPEQALQQVRLEAYTDIPCRRLSTGQLRRTALARLLMLDTRLWVLDEPLTGLDLGSRADFEQALLAHAAAGGSVILTTHHPLDPHACLKQLELGQ